MLSVKNMTRSMNKAGCQARFAPLLALLLAFAVLFGAGSAAAADGVWSISEIRGGVQVLRADLQPIALRRGVELRPGDRVVTKSDGRAVLTSGRDTIIVAPHSEISLPAPKRPGLGTRIIQEIGTIFLKVESSATRSFEVETPILAAVVKGTEFSVTANPAGTVVRVAEGAVEVSAFESRETAVVQAGQTARLDNRPGSRLIIDGSETPAGDRIDAVQEAKGQGFGGESSSGSRSSTGEEKTSNPGAKEGRTVALFVSISVLAAIAIPVAVNQAGSHLARRRKAKRSVKPADQAREKGQDAGDDSGMSA